MPDILDATGLQIATASEIRTALEDNFKSIYGADINIDQNSPDGQMIGIFVQAGVDIREKLQQVYNSFDPDRAVGVQLDERVTINHISRAGGTFSLVDITIVTSVTVDLQGLDDDFNNVNGVGFTVQDNTGTQWILVDSTTLVAGTAVLSFRAKNIGQVEATINTITNAVTIVLGVTSVNNPSAPTSVGQAEETDTQLRLRRQQSPAISANGYLNGILGQILALEGVTEAAVYENSTGSTDSNGIPAHTIWMIVEGGANSDIGQVLYNRKSYGCGMKGGVTENITTPSGGTFAAKFDRPTAVDLYLKFNLKRVGDLTYVFDQTAIKNYIVDNLTYSIGGYAETSRATDIAIAAIAAQGGNGVPNAMKVSLDGVTYVDFLSASTLASEFTLDASRIAITVV